MRIERSVAIRRSRNTVFDFVTDPGNFKQWTGLEAVRRSEGAAGVGMVETHISTFLGKRFEVPHEIVVYEPGERVEYTVSKPFPARGQILFKDEAGGTRVIMRSEGEPRGAYRVLVFFLLPITTKRLERNLSRLKAVLEEPESGYV